MAQPRKDNVMAHSRLAEMSKLRFHAFCLDELIERVPPGELGSTMLVLDRFDGATTTLRLLKQGLNAKGRQGLVKKVRLVRSESEPAVQVADMLAGAILRGITKGDHSFYAPVRDRLIMWEQAFNENPPS
jgi:hypothetical protein